MLVHQAYRYELKPNNKQMKSLKQCCGAYRFVFNWGLAKTIELYKSETGDNRFKTCFSWRKELTKSKQTELSWLYDVPKSIPESALKDLDEAYFNMIRRINNGEKKFGKPQFKKKGLDDKFRVKNDSDDKRRTAYMVRLQDKAIRIPKIGFIKTKESTSKLIGRILSATINREADRWFCALNVEVDRHNLQPIVGDKVGIDLGIGCFATITNGDKSENVYSPKPLRKSIEKIKRLHRNQDRKVLHSKNYKKSQMRLSRYYRKIRNVRKDFLAKLSTQLAKTKSVICIEGLVVKYMILNHHLSRSIGDEGWGNFRRMLEYKTQWYGSKLVVIGRFEATSKICSSCGEVNNSLTLNDRQWVCMKCGVLHDRDINAAKNIRKLGLEKLNTESSSGINACGVDVRPSQKANDCEPRSEQHLNNEDKPHGTA